MGSGEWCLLILVAVTAANGQPPAGSERLERAIALSKSGSAKEARAALEGLLPGLREAQPRNELARALTALTEVSFSLGDYGAAIRAAREAAEVDRRLGNEKGEADAWNQVALASVYLGDYASAIENYRKALAIDRKRNDLERQTVRTYNIGNVYFEQGRYLDAWREYHLALGLIGSGGTQPWTSRRRRIVTANLAILFQRLGRYQQALDLYLGSGAGSLEPSEQAQMLANLGTLYRRLGDPVKALETYRRAQDLFARQHHNYGEIGALKNIGIVFALDLGRLDEALAAFEAARTLASASAAAQLVPTRLYIAEVLLEKGRLEDARRELGEVLAASARMGSHEYDWRALFRLGQLDESGGHAGEALRSYLDAIARIESVRSGLEIPALRRDFLADKRQVYDAALAVLAGRAAPPLGEIFRLMENSRARNVQDRFPKADLQSVQARLDDGTVLLEYWSGPSMGAVLEVTRAGALLRTRPAVDVKAFRAALLGEGAAWSATSAALGEKLLAGLPSLAGSRMRRVIVVPDGPLSLIPFEALTVPATGQLLLERAPVVYAPSAALVLRGGAGRSNLPAMPWRRQLLAFADPAGRGASESLLPEAPQPLPRAREEVRYISAVLRGRSELHVGAEARKSYLLQSRDTPVLLIASHAAAEYADPERSRILMAPEPGSAGTDFLFLREIYGMDLARFDLVVLSACDTETGRLAGGEGIEGFGKAFLAAGAASTVTTLWKVGDESTAQFMRQFYFNLASGAAKADALREAKLKFLRSNGALAHPRYWAAFVMNGDGFAPLPPVAGWWWIAAGALLLAAGCLLVLRVVRGGRPRA